MSDTKAVVLAAVSDIRKVKFAAKWDSRSIAGKGTWSPTFVMVHGTAGGDSLAGLASGAYGDHRPVPGAHFLVSRDGTVHVLTHRKAYHAGRGGPLRGVAAGMMNGYAWGIEFETWQRVQDLTPAQIESGGKLIAGLLREMGAGLDRIIQHKEWAPKNKPHDTLYSTAWWKDQVSPFMSKVTVPVKTPVVKHSGKIGSSSPYHKTPVTKPVTVVGSAKPYVAAILDLPEGRYLCSFQVRMPAGAGDAEAEIVRLNFPGLAARDSTGHNPVPRARKLYDKWWRWRSPIEHSIAVPEGGGKVSFEITMPPGVHKMRFVCKATRLS